MHNLKANIKIGENTIHVFKPEICPFCETGVDPIIKDKFVVETSSGCVLYIAMECPVCGDVFFCKYLLGVSVSSAASYGIWFSYNQIFGGSAQKELFSEEINRISPSFVKIYNQSFEAEQNGLDEICGIGYRKAFEFLVKDFAIYKNPADSNKIISQQLNQCITYVFNNREKDIFEKTGWIGNDQTHYEKRHENFNIEDLKRMIMICVSKIETFIREDDYLKAFDKNETAQ